MTQPLVPAYESCVKRRRSDGFMRAGDRFCWILGLSWRQGTTMPGGPWPTALRLGARR